MWILVPWRRVGTTALRFTAARAWLYRGSDSIQVVGGLPASPSLGWPLAAPAGTLLSIASDLTGQHIVLGVAGDAAGIYQTIEGQPVVQLLAAVHPISLAFSDDGSTL